MHIHSCSLPSRGRFFLSCIGISAGIFTAVLTASANGIFREGVGAVSMSLAGASVPQSDGPLSSLASNPAGLSDMTSPTLQIGGFGGIASGDYRNTVGTGSLESGVGGLVEGAFALPLKSIPLTFGLGFIPDATMNADWQFVDPPGGQGGTTSYGLQRHQSQIIVLRTALGASYRINDQLSVGASFGLIYNRNELQAPYIFQITPGLAGAKTLLDLETDGWGYNGLIGILYKPTDALQFGLSYQTPTKVDSDGRASGDAGVQLGMATFPFTYDAEVENNFPQIVSAGASWQATERLRLAAQVDWINWSDAFDGLQITLTSGSNPGLPATLADTVPLQWRDRWVLRSGVEFAATDHVWLRGGYAYGENPVPAQTLTPMTAAILEHTLAAGVEWRASKWSIALGYQFQFNDGETVDTSILGTEYNNTRTSVNIHWIGLTTAWKF